MRLVHGTRYQATIKLSWLQRWASNDDVRARLEALGVSDASVIGDGSTRYVVGRWLGSTGDVELPDMVTDVREVT